MARIRITSPLGKRRFKIETFKGNDFTNEPANVSPYRSPYAPNMIRESIGKVRKRAGFKTVARYTAQINGVHYFTYVENGIQKKKRIVHSGTGLFFSDEKMNKSFAESFVIEGETQQAIRPQGKNLFEHKVSNSGVVDLTLYAFENGLLLLHGKATESLSFTLSPQLFYGRGANNVPLVTLNSGLKYTLSITDAGGSFNGTMYTALYDTSGVAYPSNCIFAIGNNVGGTFTAGEAAITGGSTNLNIGVFALDIAAGSEYNYYYFKLQLEQSDKATAWERYVPKVPSIYYPAAISGTNKLTISDSKNNNEYPFGTELYSLPNGAKDTLNVLTGEITRNVGKLVLNGSENWINNTNASESQHDYLNAYIENSNISTPLSSVMSTHFCFERYFIPNTSKTYLYCKPNTTAMHIVIPKYELPTPDVAGLKAWLAVNNVTVLYSLNFPFVSIGKGPMPVLVNSSEANIAVNQGKINLTYTSTTGAKTVAGTSINLTDIYCNELYFDAANNISVSRQVGNRLIIFDGKKALVLKENFTIATLESLAYTPTILIARKPNGGGTVLEAINLLSPKRTEKFLGTATDKDYHLSSTNLDAATVIVQKLDSNGIAVTLTEGTDFTVNRTSGVVSFNTAPGLSPVTGEDNIFITYSKTVAGYADKINKCDIITMYGVNGARDRLFVAGCPEYPNQDFYSQLNDPTYFGDLWYSQLGQSDSRIMGYSIVNNYLATHKDYSPDNTNIVLRRGDFVDNEAAFVIVNAFQGTGAISKNAFGTLETEPLFLTSNGIFAVTQSDVLGERYAQNRSYYLNGKLLKEPNLKDAYAIVWNQFYVLAINNSVYILDGLQYSREANDPFSHRQYEGYFWKDIKAKILFEEDGVLCFGDEFGNIKFFNTNYDELASFNDDGNPIYSCWETQEFYGSDFYTDKSFTIFGILLAAAVNTGARVWAIYDGLEELIIDYSGDARYFSYSQFSYSKFTYKTDTTPQDLIEKIKIKKVNKIRFRIENDVMNEPFGLYSATTEYTEDR